MTERKKVPLTWESLMGCTEGIGLVGLDESQLELEQIYREAL